MAKRIRLSLQQAVSGSVLLIGLLIGTAGLGYAYWQAKQSLQTTIGLNFQELARLSAAKVSLALVKEIQWVERLSASPEVRLAVTEGTRLPLDQPALRRWRAEQRQYFRSLVMVDRQGRLVGGHARSAPNSQYTQQSWWRAAVEQGHAWAGDFNLDVQGQGYWEVVVPVVAESGAVQGVLKVVVDVDELLSSVLQTRIGRTGHAMLLDEQGRVLACPILRPGDHKPLGDKEAGLLHADGFRSGAVWAEVAQDTHGGHGGIIGVASVMLPGAIAQERVWYIHIRQDPRETYEPLLALMAKLAGFWVVAVGFAAYVRARMARRIVGPLDALIARLQALADGHTPASLQTEASTHYVVINEIQSLTASFNRLVERSQAAAQETRRYVDEMEKTNRELERSGEHYRMLWNHSPDSKMIVDAEAVIRDVNRRAEIKLGRLAEELIGTSATGLFRDPDRARFVKLLDEVHESGKEGMIGEVRVPTSGGSALVMDLDIVPVEGRGEQRSFLLQLGDISERKHLEEQLLRSERLASLGQFTSMFAHDIRNPLAGIKKTLELLGQDKEIQARPTAHFVSDLQLTTDLLIGMINDMLDVYQESYSGLPLVPSSFSIQSLLQEVMSLFTPEAESKGVHFRLECPDQERGVMGDRRRLQRVGVNLVHNALKYSPPGGRITISVTPEGKSSLESKTGGGGLCIRVEDEGPGLDPVDLPNLFEMFFRKKDGHDLRIGRGLGLHFCKLVVEAHGGRIWASNRPEGGASFSVLLPFGRGGA